MLEITKNPADFAMLRQFVQDACCISLGEDKAYLFESRLGQIVAQSGASSVGAFISMARSDPTSRLRDKIVDAMTTHETYWFRDEKPWHALRTSVLPAIAKAAQASGKLRIRFLCAACSTGQEPYSLAMIIDRLHKEGKLSGLDPSRFEILGIDVSAGTLMLALNARYNQIEIARGLHSDWRADYFVPAQNNTWTIADHIRKRITFKRFNLQDNLLTLGVFDFIFCRNVAIYFDDTFKNSLFNRLSQILTPEGPLLLGATESLFNHRHLFQSEMIEGAVFHKKTTACP